MEPPPLPVPSSASSALAAPTLPEEHDAVAAIPGDLDDLLLVRFTCKRSNRGPSPRRKPLVSSREPVFCSSL
jgi:hypothetical protein